MAIRIRSRRSHTNRLPELEPLEGRRLLTVTFLQNGDILSVLGDAGVNTVHVSDDGTGGAGNIAATGDGASFTSTSHVREVIVATYDGDDQVFYTMPDQAANSPRSLRIMTEGGSDYVKFQAGKINSSFKLQVDLGIGNNIFRGDMAGASAVFDSYIAAGTGNDRILFNDMGTIEPIAATVTSPPPASVTVSIDGGAGNDVVAVYHTGPIHNGKYSAQVLGGLGDDKVVSYLTSNVLADPGRSASTSVWMEGGAGDDGVVSQQTGTLTRASAANVLQGNNGTDNVHLTQTGATFGATVNQSLTGGAGPDSLVVTDKGTIDGTYQVLLTGEDGDDHLTFSQTGDITSQGIAQWVLDGGKGNDVIAVDDLGKLSGSTAPFTPGVIHLAATGGPGNDIINANLNLSAGSKGKIGESSSPALVSGGLGNDRLTIAIRTKLSLTKISAKASGDAGSDVVKRTKATVQGSFTNEVDLNIL